MTGAASRKIRAAPRAPDRSEAEAIADLLNAETLALYGEPAITAAGLQDWFDIPGLVMRVADADGGLAAYADFDQALEDGIAWIDVREHPDRRGRAGELLDELERLAAETGATRVRTIVSSLEEPLAAEVRSRGYAVIRHSFRMLIELHGGLADPVWPDGIAVRAVRPGEEPAVHAAHTDAFADHWGFHPDEYERWRVWTVAAHSFDPSLWFLALAGEEIAGFSLCRPHDSGDPRLGYVHLLGVRPPWRRRGLGEALLRHSFRAFADRGCDRVTLGVDAENTTGAVRLYERVGMRGVRRSDTYEKTL